MIVQTVSINKVDTLILHLFNITTTVQDKMAIQWIFFCCLLSLGLAWNEPGSCYIRQQPFAEQLDEIKERLVDIATTLDRLGKHF